MLKPEMKIVEPDEVKRQALVHDRNSPTKQAAFAMDLVRIGMQLTPESGTFSKSVALMPPEQVVARAVALTELMFATFETKGWIVELPALSELMRTNRVPPGF